MSEERNPDDADDAAQERARPARLRPRRGSVFLSSTSVDLRPHRQVVIDTLLRMGLFPVAMEHMGAQPEGDATSVSLDYLAEADVYLGVVAWRYGYVPAGETRSVTHLEYEEARRRGMPIFMFLAAPETERDVHLFPEAVRQPEEADQLAAFRAELAIGHVVDFFTTPDDLGRRVAASKLARFARPRPPRDLPPRAPEFVGREAERRALAEALRRGQSVGLSAAVGGMAGVGKSALAAEVVHDMASPLMGGAEAFPGGITWMRCDGRSGLDGLGWVYDQLLAAWDASLPPDALARAGTLEAEVELRERALRARLQPADGDPQAAALVLLDNVEPGLPLTRALDTLTPLGISVLITARHEPSSQRLRLVRLDVLDLDAAAQLFAERYTWRGGDCDATRDADAAGAVAEALGRLPLAIELAAARAARARSPVVDLAAELRRPDVLDRLRDPLDPTASVRYAFEKSLALLTPAQRVRFAALGLPDGPDWPRPVIERLLAAVLPPSAAAQDVVTMAPAAHAGPAASAAADLDLLVALALVQVVTSPAVSDGRAGDGETTRVRLHPLLRELARAEWAAQPEATHAAGLASLLLAVRDLAAEHRRDFATLAREEDLIAGTVRHAATAHVEPATLADAVAALYDYIDMGGHWRLGMDLLVLQLEARRQVGDRAGEGRTLNNLGSLTRHLGQSEAARKYFEQALAIRREVNDRTGYGQNLNNLGTLALNLGQLEVARGYFEQALAILREAGDRRGEGIALNNLGVVARRLGQPPAARTYFEQALAILREVGDQAGEGQMLDNLGELASSLGEPEVARSYYEQALAVLRAVGDRAGEGPTLNNLGALARQQGQPEAARAYYEQALTIEQEIGDRRGEGTTLNNLGDLARRLGQPQEARSYFGQALVIRREVGDRAGEGATLTNLGLLAYQLGETAAAGDYYEHALTILREVGDRRGEGTTLNNLGDLARRLGEMEQARSYFEQALAVRREVGDRAGEGITLNNLGALAYQLGEMEQARSCFEQALTVLRAVGDRAGEGTALNSLGALARHLGDTVLARTYYEQALAIRRAVGDRVGEGTTLNNLGELARRFGEMEQARGYYEQALAIRHEAGDRAGEGQTLNNLGLLARQLGQPEVARTYCEQALAIHREVGDRAGEGTTLSNLGALADQQGRTEAASAYYEQALAIFEKIGAAERARVVHDNLERLKTRSAGPAQAAPRDATAPTAEPARKKRGWWPFGR